MYVCVCISLSGSQMPFWISKIVINPPKLWEYKVFVAHHRQLAVPHQGFLLSGSWGKEERREERECQGYIVTENEAMEANYTEHSLLSIILWTVLSESNGPEPKTRFLLL